MLAGAAFRYADLPPVVRDLIATEFPGLQPEPDSYWRWPNAQIERVEVGLTLPAETEPY
jgi:hypothetical protein